MKFYKTHHAFSCNQDEYVSFTSERTALLDENDEAHYYKEAIRMVDWCFRNFPVETYEIIFETHTAGKILPGPENDNLQEQDRTYDLEEAPSSKSVCVKVYDPFKRNVKLFERFYHCINLVII